MTHETLFTATEIQQRIQGLAQEIEENHRGETLDLVIVLKGAAFFGADLARTITNPCRLHFIRAKSYQGASSGALTLELAQDMNLSGKRVIVVEDMVDTGKTLKNLLPALAKEEPLSLELCALLQKREVEGVKVDYLGFSTPDLFLVGYGFDHSEAFRNLPHIAIFKP